MYVLQDKKQGEEKDQFKDGGIGERREEDKNEDEQNYRLKHRQRLICLSFV